MCYTELFETVNINIKLIKLVGLETAAYWSVLQEVLPKVKAKKTYDPATGFFPLKREYVTERIGLPIESQYKCDKALADLGLLKVDPEDPDRISANVKGLVALIVDEDPDTLAKAATVGKKASKAYRRECQIAALRKCIAEKDPAVADKLSVGIRFDEIDQGDRPDVRLKIGFVHREHGDQTEIGGNRDGAELREFRLGGGHLREGHEGDHRQVESLRGARA